MRDRRGASGKKSDGDAGHNGYITALAEYACRELGFGWREAFSDVPAATIALLMRQTYHLRDPSAAIPLSEIEKIDNGLIRPGRQPA